MARSVTTTASTDSRVLLDHSSCLLSWSSVFFRVEQLSCSGEGSICAGHTDSTSCRHVSAVPTDTSQASTNVLSGPRLAAVKASPLIKP
jgi:hypothetical protein